MLFYLTSPASLNAKKHFAQKSQLELIKYGSSGAEARARTLGVAFLMCRQTIH